MGGPRHERGGEHIRTLLHQMRQRKALEGVAVGKGWGNVFVERIGCLASNVGRWWKHVKGKSSLPSFPNNNASCQGTSSLVSERMKEANTCEGGRPVRQGRDAIWKKPDRHPQSEGEDAMNSIVHKIFSWGIATKL